MSASRLFCLSKQFCYIKSFNLKGVYNGSILGRPSVLTSNNISLFIYTSKRHFFDFVGINVESIFRFWYPKNKIVSPNESSKKEVYLLTDHIKSHEKVPRVRALKELSSTVQSIKGNRTKAVYIGGLPGIGKKELARQYAEQQYENLERERNRQIFVATINASDPNSFHHDLFKVIEKTKVVENYQQFEKNVEKPGGYKDMLYKLSTHLQNCSGWVLVLNGIKFNTELHWLVGETHNVVNENLQSLDLSDSLPPLGGSSDGLIIATTCDSFAKRHFNKNIKYFDMPNGMDKQEALQLLEHASMRQSLQQCDSVEKVIHSLQYVPTSIYCAGLVARNKKRFGKPFNYLYRIIQRNDFSNILKMADKERVDDFQYPRRMRNMQKFTVEDLSTSDDLRKKVYTLLACCASSAIPTEFITKVCGDWSKQDYFIEDVKYGSEDSRINIPSQTRNLLTWITELFEGPNTPSEKLIDYEAVEVADGYHEIFKELFLPLKEDTFLEEFIHNLIVFYDENSTRDNVYTITTRKLLLPHVHSFLQLAESTNNESFQYHIADLNWCLGNAYRLENNFKEPSIYFEKALDIYKSRNDILKQVKVNIELGKVYRDDSSTLNKSLSVLHQAQSLLHQNYDEPDLEAVLYHFKVLSNMGATNKVLGKYDESLQCYSECLEVLPKLNETEEINQLKFMTFLNLSSVERKVGKNWSCAKYIEKAESLVSESLSNEHPLLEAELKHQKAIVERDLCLPEKSVGLLREVCETIKNIYGENHVKVALIESELSVSLRHKNDLEGSKQVALSALQKLQQGDLYHSEKAKALCNLGTTYTHLCEFDEAEKYLEQALEIAESQFDISSHTWAIRTTEILEKLGRMKRRKGEVNDSYALLMRCVELKNKHYFLINHPDLAQAYVALGKTQHRMSILPESLDSLSQALSISKEHFGSDHPQTIFVKAYIAKVYRDAGDISTSLKMINEAIYQYEEQIKIPEFTRHLEKHPQYVAMYATKGMLMMDELLKNPDHRKYGSIALNSLQKALNLQKTSDAPSVLQKIEIQCHLGRVHCSLKNRMMATEMFKNTFEIASLSIGKNHPLTASILANWSRIYYENNDVDTAIEKLEEAWKIYSKFLSSDAHPNSLLYAYHLANYYNQIEDFENAGYWYSVAINGYAYLISKEDIRIKNLNKESHVVLKKNRLPSFSIWHQRLEECRDHYKRLPFDDS